MSASLIRSRTMVTHAIDRHRWNEITDGAVLQEDGTIVELGTYQELSRKHPNVAVVGSGNEASPTPARHFRTGFSIALFRELRRGDLTSLSHRYCQQTNEVN